MKTAIQSNQGPLEGGFTRRRFLRLMGGGGLVLLGGSAAFLGGGTGRTGRMMRASRAVMGTRATILLAAPSRPVGEAILEQAFLALREVDSLMSRYRVDSDVGRLNAHPGIWREVRPPTARVLQAGLEVARATDGYFDPCLDRLVSQWGFHGAGFPDPQTIEGGTHSSSKPPYRSLEVERTSGQPARFRLKGGNTGVDLGGIAKGYGIDRAVHALRDAGISSALVNVGDDLYAMGRHPDGGAWRIGVRHPREPGGILEVLEVREEAVATSGDYENYFEFAGKRYPHLLDPHSGRPASYHRSLTVRAPTAMLADALASAGFAAPPGISRAMLRRLAPESWLAVDAAGRVIRG